MKDIKHLNDKLDMDLSAVEARVASIWNDCHLATICIFPGQFHSDLPEPGDTVFHHNLKINVITSETVEKACKGCDEVDECPGLCEDPPDLDDDPDVHFHGPDSVVADMINSCDNCDTGDPESCDTCCREQPEPDEFNKLKDEHWNIMCRWALTACRCEFQFEDTTDDLLMCTHDMADQNATCHFHSCPKIHNA